MLCVVQGFVFAILPERIRTLDALLSELNRSPVCDRFALPSGVRQVLNMDGTVVQSVDELVDGGSYVCSSTSKLRAGITYTSTPGPTWNCSARPAAGTQLLYHLPIVFKLVYYVSLCACPVQ